eukprot:4892102-Lingulodinium_polyedra.AAC.1
MDGVNEEPGDDEREDDEPDYRLPRTNRIAVWGNARGSERRDCKAQAPDRLVKGRASEQGQHPEGYDLWTACTNASVQAQDALLSQTADEERGMWPIDGPRWTPAPRPVPPALANARWVRSRCPTCRGHVRTLVSIAPLNIGDEVTVANTDRSTVAP